VFCAACTGVARCCDEIVYEKRFIINGKHRRWYPLWWWGLWLRWRVDETSGRGGVGGAWYTVAVIPNFVGLAFDEHATAGMLYSNNSAFYCVWYVVTFLMIEGSSFTIQKYLVSVALSSISHQPAHTNQDASVWWMGLCSWTVLELKHKSSCWYCYRTCWQ
jgi:hypothetical protein